MEFVKTVWQLPQVILGNVFYCYWKTRKRIAAINDYKSIAVVWVVSERFNGVSLGNKIFINSKLRNDPYVVEHQFGHSRQSMILGSLYLLLVGIPSFTRAIRSYFMLKSETYSKVNEWYYSGYPEKWADKLGNVDRALFSNLYSCD